MKNNREVAIKETLKWEGGYSNHPNDSGGPTNWGITMADARKYWKKDATAADIKKMPQDVAIKIYTEKYWITPYYNCDRLESGVDLATFDFGVNSGPSRSKRYLDMSVGGSSVDTINKLCDARLKFMKVSKNSKTGQPLWPSFGKGWTRRVAGIRAKSLELAKKPTATTGIGSAGTIAIGGSVAAAMTSDVNYLPYIIAGVIAASVATYFTVRWYKQRKVSK